MSIHKILDFGGTKPHLGFRFLQYVAGKKNLSWEFAHHDHFKVDLLEGASAAFVDPALSAEVLSQFHVVPTQVRSVELLDSLFLEDGAWYPRLLIHEALRRVLVADAKDLDIRAPAFIIGDGDLSRVVAAVLAEMGIAEIFLVGDLSRLKEQKRILSRSQLGIVFHILASEELTMQATSAGIVVNTADLSQQQVLLTDLSYFNFMKQAGFALDISFETAENTLLDEAERAELRALSPALIMRTLLVLWFEKLHGSNILADHEAVQFWTEFLKENPSSV